MFEAKECKTASGYDPNKPCVFPFTHEGYTYNACTTDYHTTAWCATMVYENGTLMNWGNCEAKCYKDGKLIFSRNFWFIVYEDNL